VKIVHWKTSSWVREGSCLYSVIRLSRCCHGTFSLKYGGASELDSYSVSRGFGWECGFDREVLNIIDLHERFDMIEVFNCVKLRLAVKSELSLRYRQPSPLFGAR
jgi:hypothetical protein